MLTLREWATPLTIGSFIISAITGAVIFFHIRIGLVRPAHEWLSWFLVLGGILHIITNWTAIIRYFSRPISSYIITGFIILSVLVFIPISEKKVRPLHLSGNALLDTSLQIVALVAKEEPDDLLGKLRKRGVLVKNFEQTVQEIAVQNNKSGKVLLGLIFE
jgi:Domain of unknown function (DUF4405)